MTQVQPIRRAAPRASRERGGPAHTLTSSWARRASATTRCGLILFCSAIAMEGGPAAAQVVGERVIGGRDAAQGAWPYQAFIRIDTAKGTFACGGTLVAPDWILTAAHCAVDAGSRVSLGPTAFQVRLGSVKRSQGGELRRVSRVIVHPDFGAGSDLANDIALLQLSERSALPLATLEGASSARAAPSATASPWAKVIGWGVAKLVGRETPETLQEASLPLIDAARCDVKMSAIVPKAGKIDERRICAGANEGGVDSCNGDSGGPLLVSDGRGGWTQVGIVSYGVSDCGRADTYGVYTRVGYYAPWIVSQTGAAAKPAPAASAPPLSLGVTAAAPGVMANATKRHGEVQVQLSRRDLRLGDTFDIRVTSTFDGYLALFDLNDQNVLTQLFPNPRSQFAYKDGAIRAGAALTLPDPSYGFALEASEPKGRGRIIAVVSKSREALAGFRAADGFSEIADADKRLAALDRALTSGAPSSRWAADIKDYIVR